MQYYSKNDHKDMKAPVTTHDILLLAESKLSYTSIRNSGKRTQTAGIVGVCVCACSFNSHEEMPWGPSF